MKMRLQLTRHQAVLRVMTLALPLIVSSGTANAQDPVNCTGSNGNSKVAVPTTICSSGVAGSMAYVDAALVDQEIVRNGRAASEPWKFYDLGHGYCTYDFFEQCPHRMACAKCDFYMPKESSSALLLEGKQNLLRLLQEIPLSEDEQAAVEEGVSAHERLIAKLAHVPTPSGQSLYRSGQKLVPLTALRP